jgi:hypothetical protein
MGAPTRGSADRVAGIGQRAEADAEPLTAGQKRGPEAGAVSFNAADWRPTVVDRKCL